MTDVVAVEDVSFAYDTRPAVENVSLTVEAGEFLGLVGPNGSGKTTLLLLMLGVFRPDSGQIYLFGEPVESFDDGHRVGYVAQRTGDSPSHMPVTVEEVVTMGRYAHVGLGRLTADDHRAVREAMETVGIATLADRRITDLSGGQRQRAFIARALASEADLLALDEPAIGVDAESRDAFYALLDRLNDDGITIILIDHDIGVVTDRADTIACINRRLFHHGDPVTFLESDALAEAYGADHRLLEHDH